MMWFYACFCTDVILCVFLNEVPCSRRCKASWAMTLSLSWQFQQMNLCHEMCHFYFLWVKMFPGPFAFWEKMNKACDSSAEILCSIWFPVRSIVKKFPIDGSKELDLTSLVCFSIVQLGDISWKCECSISIPSDATEHNRPNFSFDWKEKTFSETWCVSQSQSFCVLLGIFSAWGKNKICIQFAEVWG